MEKNVSPCGGIFKMPGLQDMISQKKTLKSRGKAIQIKTFILLQTGTI